MRNLQDEVWKNERNPSLESRFFRKKDASILTFLSPFQDCYDLGTRNAVFLRFLAVLMQLARAGFGQVPLILPAKVLEFSRIFFNVKTAQVH